MAARDDVDGDVNLLVTGTAVTLADDDEECEDLWKIEPPSRRQPGCAFTLRDPHALDKPAPPPVVISTFIKFVDLSKSRY